MRNLLQILNEAAADNQAMINPVLAALRPNARTGANGIAVDLADEWRSKISEQWKQQIAHAKTLRKADRITWYLRLSRMAIIQIYMAAFDQAKINKLIHDYNSRCSLPFDQDSFGIGDARHSDSINDLEHYLSLPIAGIQNYQFRFQSFTEVLNDFQALENKWKETVKNTIEDNDSKVIIDCGGGWFWVNTEKAYCDKESAAMGHCGNSPRQHSDDQLLSLRKKIVFGQEVRWEPHLTFILNSGGMLTEMKGKGNEKPAEKYHPMIIKLLLNDLIKGIIGGGYLPENNFNMKDLDESDRDELVEKKPELGNAGDLYEKYGASDEAFDRAVNDLHNMSLEVESWEGDTVILESWKSVAEFFRSGTYDSDAEKIAFMADGDFNGWMDMKDSEQILEAILDSQDDEVRAALADRLGVRRENVVSGLLHMFPNSLSAVWDEVREEIQKKANDAAIAKINGMRLSGYDVRLNVNDAGEVVASMDFRSLCFNISAYLQEDFDNTDGFEYCVHEGSWLATQEDDGNDYRDPDEEDMTEVTDDSLYADADDLAIEHLKGLFHDDDQLSFDF